MSHYRIVFTMFGIFYCSDVGLFGFLLAFFSSACFLQVRVSLLLVNTHAALHQSTLEMSVRSTCNPRLFFRRKNFLCRFDF